ncbi:hypothetical protein [Vibrio comitans]|uniref:Uncharacterized protein n=1 Tax=Vibrio comitans NBRC 102076 TaxID=1219078 RepID=A0A4Y3IQ43_9VIBR|nr:hypothetical protein [Vibrio comitans]GEA61195.1 hypothetical protein VCO01S_23880 [Vibrio comitans NBRC 102076]
MNKFILVSSILVSAVAHADTISIQNISDSPIYGAFQSQSMIGPAADSVNGWIHSGRDHIYFPHDSFLISGAINISKGDKIKYISVFDPYRNEYIPCGNDVVFEDALTYKYDGSQCYRDHRAFAYSTSEPFDITLYGSGRGGALARKELIELPNVESYKGIRTVYDMTQKHSGYAREYMRYTSTFLYARGLETQRIKYTGYIDQDTVNKVDWHAPLGATGYFSSDGESVELIGIPGGDKYSIQHENRNGNQFNIDPDTGEITENKIEWSNLRIELFNPIISEFYSSTPYKGEWHRPDFDYFTGEDLGRTEEKVSYRSWELEVDTAGVYGFKVQAKSGSIWSIPVSLYVFEGELPVSGDYGNLLGQDSGGVPHIASVFLEPNKKYTFVISEESVDRTDSTITFIGGPGEVNLY